VENIICKILKRKQEFQEWNNFVAQSKLCTLLQSSEWGEFKKISSWQPIRIGIYKDEQIIGGISILKRKIPLIGKSLFYAPRGPILDFHNKEILSILIEKIKKVAKKHNGIILKIDPEIEEDDEKSRKVLEQLNFKFIQKQIQPRATFLIDLTEDLDTILMKCKSKHRYNIRLSHRKGVKVKEMTNEKGMEFFYDIYLKTARRNNFMIHPRAYYQRILKIMGKKGMVHIFIAYYKEEPIAGVYIFSFGEKIWYIYGSSSNKYRNTMPNHALHWEVIKWAKVKGYKIYDLCGIPAKPHPDHPLFGVYRFKKGFQGTKKIFIGMHDLVLQPFWYHLLNKGIKTYTSMRSLIKKGKISDSLAE